MVIHAVVKEFSASVREAKASRGAYMTVSLAKVSGGGAPRALAAGFGQNQNSEK
jgi:hypothetical protein